MYFFYLRVTIYQLKMKSIKLTRKANRTHEHVLGTFFPTYNDAFLRNKIAISNQDKIQHGFTRRPVPPNV